MRVIHKISQIRDYMKGMKRTDSRRRDQKRNNVSRNITFSTLKKGVNKLPPAILSEITFDGTLKPEQCNIAKTAMAMGRSATKIKQALLFFGYIVQCESPKRKAYTDQIAIRYWEVYDKCKKLLRVCSEKPLDSDGLLVKERYFWNSMAISKLCLHYKKLETDGVVSSSVTVKAAKNTATKKKKKKRRRRVGLPPKNKVRRGRIVKTSEKEAREIAISRNYLSPRWTD